MKRTKSNSGFTMAELLIVVAIIVVLMGVSFVPIMSYLRSLQQMDMDSAAKEIFIAAQNHLSAANSQGMLEIYKDSPAGSVYTTTDKEGKKKTSYYIVCPPSGSESDGVIKMFNLMLPFGAIDETVRAGGSYLVRYSAKDARVLDVFYAKPAGARFGCDLSAYKDATKFTKLMSDCQGEDKKAERRNYKGAVIGWYGGAGLGEYEDYLARPTIKVDNGDTLKVTVSPLEHKKDKKNKPINPSDTTNSSPALSLIVEGETSHAMKEYPLVSGGADALTPLTDAQGRKRYEIPLDNLTVSGGNFAQSCVSDIKSAEKSVEFFPGENLLIRAVAFDNGILSNIAESGTVRVNSLFGELVTQQTKDDYGNITGSDEYVTIYSFRHLMNLDYSISGLDWKELETQNVITNSTFIKAVQTSDLDWNQFMNPNPTDTTYKFPGVATHKIFGNSGGSEGIAQNGSYPSVTPSKKGDVEGERADLALIYEGGSTASDGSTTSHIIKNVVVDTSGNAGLFASLPAIRGASPVASSVKNLDLKNFNISSTGGSAGALAGEATVKEADGNIPAGLTNVRAYNDLSDDSAIQIEGKNAGGLVGTFSGSADSCAAAVYVKGGSGESDSAGGLFGQVSSGTVQHSYSGGHTIDGLYKKKNADTGKYEIVTDDNGKGRLNVQGGTAGGLIGTLASGTEVNDCYSTCSVGSAADSAKVGGFVGSGAAKITDSYCTGLVNASGNKATVGTFAGSMTLSTGSTGNYYLEIVNHRSTVKDENGKDVTAGKEDQIPTLGNNAADTTVNAIDESASSYDTFLPTKTVEGTTVLDLVPGAAIYDDDLKTKAEKQGDSYMFAFKHVQGQTKHLGDWPVYETYVYNTN